MSIRIKLILPGVLILCAVLVLALGPAAPKAGLPAVLLAAAALAVVAQWLANERWVFGALRAIDAALAGRPMPRVHAGEWQDVVARIAGLQTAARTEQSVLDEARSRSRQVEEALRASEERYVLAVRGAHDGVWEWDPGAGRIWLSPRWRHMFGLDDGSDTMSADAWRDRLHPEDRDEAVATFEAHLAGRSDRFEHAHRLIQADGRYRWVLSRGTALRRASGAAYRVIGLDTDITRLKRVESIVDTVARGTANRSGEPFFQSLVQHFAHALNIQCAFITECLDRPPTRVRTLAFWRDGSFDRNFEYELAGTPCEAVICGGRTELHPTGLAGLFPCEAGHQSYLGLPIVARDGIVIGHLAFVDSDPMAPDIVIESVYRIFTARAAVEIELTRALQRLDAAEAPARAAA